MVARVGRALGVKGDLLVDVLTDEPERRLLSGGAVFAMGSDRVLRIESTRPHGGRLCVHFAGVDDRSAAEALTGLLLEAERRDGERPFAWRARSTLKPRAPAMGSTRLKRCASTAS